MKFTYAEVTASIKSGNNAYLAQVCDQVVTVWKNDGKMDMLMNAAAAFGNDEALRMMVKSGANLNAKNDNGDSLLHGAARNRHLETMAALLSIGMKVDSKNFYETTPLHICCSMGWLEGVEFLIKSGASVTGTDDRNRNALQIAAGAEVSPYSKDIITLLIQSGSPMAYTSTLGDDPVKSAIDKHNAEALEALLDHGLKMQSSQRDPRTILQYATSSSAANVIALLARRGYDMNEVNSNGDTALHRACNIGLGFVSQQVIRELILAGVDPHIYNHDCRSMHEHILNHTSIPGLVECYESAIRERMAMTIADDFKNNNARTRTPRI